MRVGKGLRAQRFGQFVAFRQHAAEKLAAHGGDPVDQPADADRQVLRAGDHRVDLGLLGRQGGALVGDDRGLLLSLRRRRPQNLDAIVDIVEA